MKLIFSTIFSFRTKQSCTAAEEQERQSTPSQDQHYEGIHVGSVATIFIICIVLLIVRPTAVPSYFIIFMSLQILQSQVRSFLSF